MLEKVLKLAQLYFIVNPLTFHNFKPQYSLVIIGLEKKHTDVGILVFKLLNDKNKMKFGS